MRPAPSEGVTQATRVGMLFVTLIIHGVGTALATNVVADRWRSSSRLTPAEAAEVLYREASGAMVLNEDLFEAEKHLRSDGAVSPNEYVLNDVFTRLLQSERGLHSRSPRIEPPLLHWLESRPSARGIELRGESLQLAVVYDVSGVRVRLRHRTLHHVWEDCGGELCLSSIREPLRPDVSYRWSASPVTCDPMPWPRRPPADSTLDVTCVFTGRNVGSVRVGYAAEDAIASPPSQAAASAVVHNPLDVRLFE